LLARKSMGSSGSLLLIMIFSVDFDLCNGTCYFLTGK